MIFWAAKLILKKLASTWIGDPAFPYPGRGASGTCHPPGHMSTSKRRDRKRGGRRRGRASGRPSPSRGCTRRSPPRRSRRRRPPLRPRRALQATHQSKGRALRNRGFTRGRRVGRRHRRDIKRARLGKRLPTADLARQSKATLSVPGQRGDGWRRDEMGEARGK